MTQEEKIAGLEAELKKWKLLTSEQTEFATRHQRDTLRAQQEAMSAGNSWINAHNVFPHGVPYGGVNKSGLGGGVLSIETLMDYYRHTSVVRPLS